MVQEARKVSEAKELLLVNEFIDGVLDPEKPMLGPLKDGGHIVAHTAPGCWGPMITPCIKGGHEVTKPVWVEGAEVGDALVIEIKSIEVTSRATASGNDRPVEGRFLGDPFVAVKCPGCGTLYPQTVIEGIGQEAIRCAECRENVTPFEFTNGYTMVFDEGGEVGVTLTKESAEEVARSGREYMNTPENSVQNPVVTFAPHDLVGVIARTRPFLGQLGTTPSRPTPDSHNAGDFGSFLVGAPHEYACTDEELETHRTDGHMDINRVRAGAVLVCPVKVPGGGVYLGDMHAMQGDGEIAGHTTDVAGIVHLRVHVLKKAGLAGPVLFPNAEDLPYTAKPITAAERIVAEKVAARWKVPRLEESLPVSFVGTGPTLNDATGNGMQRAADAFGVTVEEIMNRATITGAIEIGRHPGVVTVTFLAPVEYLKKAGLDEPAAKQYRKD
ncbi:acetamidase/formamidase family protein [Bhargavaea ullalensis]|uniref:Acetamidase/formamidase n=1 Tax=Bhargavaea ullalensis TaxID=1265685 RepID=A0ABV2G9N1_9BACL